MLRTISHPRNLRDHLRKKKFTQTKLSFATGVPQGDISKYVNGREPGVRRALKIAAALETSVEKIWHAERAERKGATK